MRTLTPIGSAVNITNASKANQCVLTCVNSFNEGDLVLIEDVEGMTELNDNFYVIVSASSTSITIDVDSTGFTTYTGSGTATAVAPVIQFSEVELHSFILNVSPSQWLA
jgi:ribosomal protein L31